MKIVIKLILCLAAFVGISTTRAQVNKNIHMLFSEKNYSLSDLGNGEFIIVPKTSGGMVSYKNNSIVPYYSLNILVGPKVNSASIIMLVNKDTLISNIKLLSPTKKAHRTNSVVSGEPTQVDSCFSPVKNIKIQNIGGYKLVSFIFTPFVYDQSNSALTVKQDFTFQITMEEAILSDSHKEQWKQDIVRKLVVNNDDMEMLYPQTNANRQEESIIEKCDYLVITQDSLKNAFHDFIFLKGLRGMRVQIVSVEDIYNQFSDYSYALRIKKFIKTVKNCHPELEYVLLAGETSAIPSVKMRCIDPTDTISKNFHSDIYYACLEGNLDWENGGNSAFSQNDSSINLTQNIIVSRLPMANTNDIKQYIGKLYRYETNSNGQNDSVYCSILLTGGKTYYTINGISDSHYKGLQLLSDWGNHYMFSSHFIYDTGTDVPGMTSIGKNNFKELMKRGCTYLYVDSHGEYNQYHFYNTPQPDSLYYFNYEAMSIQSGGPFFIFTNACYTNNFTISNSLGNSFLKSCKCNTLAYLGSTHRGTSHPSVYVGGTQGLNLKILEEMFSSSTEYITIGNAMFKAKQELLNYVTQDVFELDDDRWTYLTTNMIGDPSAPMYSEQVSMPQSSSYNLNGTIYAQVYHYDEIKVLGEDDSGIKHITPNLVQHIGNDDLYSFPCDEMRNIHIGSYSVNKYIKNIDTQYDTDLYLQNTVISNDLTLFCKDAHIGFDVTDKCSQGVVIVKNGAKLTICYCGELDITKGFTCEKGGEINFKPIKP